MINKFNIDVYATLEIRNDGMIFSVFKYIGNNPILLFTRKSIAPAVLSSNWLDKEEHVKDTAKTAKEFSKMISEFENSYDGLKIDNVILIAPNKNIKYTEKPFTSNFVSESNPHGIIVTKKVIKKIISDLKIKSKVENCEIFSEEIIEIQADNKCTTLERIANIQTEKLTVRIKFVHISEQMLNSHRMVITKAGKEVLKVNGVNTRISSLYNAVADQYNKKQRVLVIDWKESQIEAGVFEGRKLVCLKTFVDGTDKIISMISKKLRVSKEIAKKYLMHNLDFGSNNNDQSVVYQNWNSTNKALDKMTGLQIKDAVATIFDSFYGPIKRNMSKNFTQGELITHNFGTITEIPGVETILRGGSKFANDYVYGKRIFGANNNHEMVSAIGAVNYAKIMNSRRKERQDKIVTSIYSGINIQQSRDQETENRAFGNFVPKKSRFNANQPLFLKDNGILIDEKKFKS
ncbi:hypothetical protein CXP39_01505 [Mesoplasma syrphidae]|uniref:Uncharacterized protein n=1 Tax=Mesoplasma syrphidae TaxID=225999 RepID=A0A2K9CCU6_9MOLU|nr:hypothetical protein [Mesoplasma syrphidae]AUF83474.1 hypothetical protein CXP39_01505 [Mesoplasma syrphidae]